LSRSPRISSLMLGAGDRVITDAVLSFFQGLVSVVFGWLPNPTPPDLGGYVSQLAPVWQYFAWANNYVPLTEVMAFLSVMIGLWFVMALVRVSVWALTKAHVFGGQ
jgi:hypothetical protein